MKALTDKLAANGILSKAELLPFLSGMTDKDREYLFARAREAALANFGNKIYIRGLIEFTNICKNNCYYCGIRAGNESVRRYRLSEEQILSCCADGYALGFRTFVLQGGEDPYFTDDILCGIIAKMRAQYPDCAITLSLGERARESYKRLFTAGANRYLLRHETICPEHYARLHPASLSLENRLSCLKALKEIGFQTGTGIMVGSPYQTNEMIADDVLFIKNFAPQMIGIGPFLPHRDTPFKNEKAGSAVKTAVILAILRLMLPRALIPSTTALGTVQSDGREMGILAGANVVMPNLSPAEVRADYSLYDGKLYSGEESAQSLEALKQRISQIGYEIVTDRGDADCP